MKEKAQGFLVSYYGNLSHCFQKNGDSSGETNMKSECECENESASFVASCAYLVCVAGVGAERRLGAGGGGCMSMGWGRHMEEGREPGVYTHLSARYGVHC